MVEYQVTGQRVWDSEEEEGVKDVVLEGALRTLSLSVADQDAAHIYYLQNHVLVTPYFRY